MSLGWDIVLSDPMLCGCHADAFGGTLEGSDSVLLDWTTTLGACSRRGRGSRRLSWLGKDQRHEHGEDGEGVEEMEPGDGVA